MNFRKRSLSAVEAANYLDTHPEVVTTALGGPWGSGSALDVSDLDISAYVSSTGWHEILLSSTTLGVIIAQVSTKAQLRTT